MTNGKNGNGKSVKTSQLSDEQKETVAMVREAFTEAKERELKLSDNVLLMVMERAGKFDEMEENEQFDLLEKAEQEADKQSIADPAISRLVAKIDDTFESEITACVDAVIKGKTTAVDIYAQFKRIYTQDEMNSLPIPGTDKDHVTGNQKPDKVKTKDQTGKPITVVWTNDFVSSMARGKEYETDIDEASKELKTSGSVPRFKSLGKKELTTIKVQATQKRNALRSMVKRAMQVHHQLEALSTLPKVEWEWIPGTKTQYIALPSRFGIKDLAKDKDMVKVTLSPKPLWIYPKGQASNGREFSITQLLSFDCDAAKNGDEGGTMADLISTAGRGTADKPDTTGTGENMPIEAAETTCSALVEFLNKRDNMALIRKKISNLKADPDGADWLDNIGTLYLLIKPIYTANKAAYDAIQQKEEPEESEAA